MSASKSLIFASL